MTTNQEETKIDTKIAFLPMTSIAIALDVEPKELLTYEKEGILNPEKKKDNLRYYSINDLEKAKITRFLTKDKMMELRGIRILLAVLEKFDIKLESCFDYIQKLTSAS